MSIIDGYLMPHPPILVPQVGKGEEKSAHRTLEALNRAAEEIRDEAPVTIVLTSPHAPLFEDYIHISSQEELTGTLERFGAPEVKLAFRNNLKLVHAISRIAEKQGIPAGTITEENARRFKLPKTLDHGALVPLYFITRKYTEFSLVHISLAAMPYRQLYRFGMCIAEAAAELGEKTVFVASGDLSHRLLEEGPYGFDPQGPRYDKLLVDSLEKLEVEKLLNLEEDFCEQAGECGHRSVLMMLGALDGKQLKTQVYSYEDPFGVGYAVARLQVMGEDRERQVLQHSLNKARQGEDPYVKLARASLEAYVRNGQVLKLPENLPAGMLAQRAGAFVSLKRFGELRGCIGTIFPTQDSVAQEIIHNAISSGTQDPRFYPVKPDELDTITYSVDILGEPEPIQGMDQLDVIRYGVIVRSGRRSGLLLPNLEGVAAVEEQVSIALQKAGIKPNEKYSMERFEVIRHQ